MGSLDYGRNAVKNIRGLCLHLLFLYSIKQTA